MSYTIDLSSHGKELKSAYDDVVANERGKTWAVFNYEAGKTNVLKPSAEGNDLQDFVEEFDDGKVQYGFARVSDPDSALPKFVLVGWVGEGVPERTKGYFNAHFSTVARYFPGYHVQITARSQEDLSVSGILQKVGTASGAKYSGSSSVPLRPKYTEAASGASEEDWGDAPAIVESEITKVPSAYKPTKVDIAAIRRESTSERPSLTAEPKKSEPIVVKSSFQRPEPVRGAYEPVGKVDIAAIRAKARESNFNDRPAPLQSSYKPVGKVDINAIRAQAGRRDELETAPTETAPEELEEQEEIDAAPKTVKERLRSFGGPATTPFSSTLSSSSSQPDNEDDTPKSFQDRLKAFSGSGRLSELPKPKVSHSVTSRFNPGAGSGTVPPLPVNEFSTTPSLIGGASRDFGSENGKTPAQIWAEKHAKKTGGQPISSPVSKPDVASVSSFSDHADEHHVSDLSSRFESTTVDEDVPPPALNYGSRPSLSDSSERPSPGLPQRNLPPAFRPEPKQFEPEEEEPEQEPQYEPEQEPEPEPEPEPEYIPEPEPEPEPDHSSFAADKQAIKEAFAGGLPTPSAIPPQVVASDPAPASTAVIRATVQYSYEKDEENEISLEEGELVVDIEFLDPEWWKGTNSKGESGLFPSSYVELKEDGGAEHEVGEPVSETVAEIHEAPSASGPSAIAEYDYEAQEEGELSFPEGAKITDIEFPDENWWSGVYNGTGGLFPAGYVRLEE